MSDRPEVVFIDERQVMKINGIDYAYAIFEKFGMRGLEVGTILRILRREDNALVVQRLSPAKGVIVFEDTPP